VTVTLSNDGNQLGVRVVDDGVGLPDGFAPDGSTLGLTIVRALVTSELGGTLSMTTDGGTSVDVRVPVSPAVSA
jgi:two-component sensor histidine kinase